MVMENMTRLASNKFPAEQSNCGGDSLSNQKRKLTIVATVRERTECDYLDDHFNNKNVKRDVVDELRDAFKSRTLVT